jgi:hypothetical protein
MVQTPGFPNLQEREPSAIPGSAMARKPAQPQEKLIPCAKRPTENSARNVANEITAQESPINSPSFQFPLRANACLHPNLTFIRITVGPRNMDLLLPTWTDKGNKQVIPTSSDFPKALQREQLCFPSGF